MLAGVVIKYSWGMSKTKFRPGVDDGIPSSMSMRTSFHSRAPRQSSRRSECVASPVVPVTHCRAYLELEEGEDVQWKEMIERMKKKCQLHRNILDMKPGIIGRQLSNESRGRGSAWETISSAFMVPLEHQDIRYFACSVHLCPIEDASVLALRQTPKRSIPAYMPRDFAAWFDCLYTDAQEYQVRV